MSDEPVNVTDVWNAHRAIEQAAKLAKEEAFRAVARFKPFNSSHEGWAVLYEEVCEMWKAIMENDLEAARAEAIQVTAMGLRFIAEVPGTKHRKEGEP